MQEHKFSLARTRTQTARSRKERTNHEAIECPIATEVVIHVSAIMFSNLQGHNVSSTWTEMSLLPQVLTEKMDCLFAVELLVSMLH